MIVSVMSYRGRHGDGEHRQLELGDEAIRRRGLPYLDDSDARRSDAAMWRRRSIYTKGSEG